MNSRLAMRLNRTRSNAMGKRLWMGLACLPRDQVQADIAAGRLVAVLETQTPPLPAYHFYYPSRRQSSPAFRLLVEALLRGTRTPAAQ